MKFASDPIALGLAAFAGLSHGATIPRADAAPAALWQPALGAPWQIVLSNKLDLRGGPVVPDDVEIFDIDLYDNTVDGDDDTTIRTLHDQNKKVICYFSAGTVEEGRPDEDDFPPEDVGKVLPEWPDEKWVKLGSDQVRKVIAARIAVAAKVGCDAIDPDNVDGYDNDNGLGLTAQDSIDFVKFVAAEAEKYNMSTGLKNAGAIVNDVLGVIQFAVNEQCVCEEECSVYDKLIAAKKPVFHIEYPPEKEDDCPVVGDLFEFFCDGSDVPIPDFSTVTKNMTLDGWTHYCGGRNVTTIAYPEEGDD